MPDEATMLAAYAASYPDDTDRLILADWLEERGDVHGAWLRDPDLAHIMGPNLDDPRAKLIAALGNHPRAEELLARFATPDLDPLLRLLASDDPREQRAALAALEGLGEQAAPAVPAILERLRDSRGSVRVASIATLDALGRYASAALFVASEVIDDAEIFEAVLAREPDLYTVRCLYRARHLGQGVGERADARLTEYGAAAFPGLLAVVVDIDPGDWDSVHKYFANSTGHAWLLDTARDVNHPQPERVLALRLLGFYSDTPFPTQDDKLIPGLIDLLRDNTWEVVEAAQHPLRRFRERARDACPALECLLAQSPPSNRVFLIQTLIELGSGALPTFTRLVSSEDPELRSYARQGLLTLNESSWCIERVREWLASSLSEERLDAVKGLAIHSGQFPDLDALLLTLLDDPIPAVRKMAVQVIERMQWPTGIDPALCWRAVLTGPELRANVLESLRFWGENIVPLVLPEVIDIAQNSGNPDIRIAALGCLHGEGLARPEVQQAALVGMLDPNPAVFQAALSLLGEHWRRRLPTEAVQVLLARIRNDPSSEADTAIEYLVRRRSSPGDPPPSPDLLAALRYRLRTHPISPGSYLFQALDRVNYVPEEVDLPILVRELDLAHVSWLIERHGPGCIPYLLPILNQDSSPDAQETAARILGNLGSASRPVLPALISLLTSADARVKSGAAEAIAEIAEPAELVEWLRHCFQDRDWNGAQFALEVAGKLGPLAVAWLPEILAVVQTEEAELAVKTHPVLIALAEQSPEVVPRLAAMVQDPDPIASANAQAALDAIAAARDD